MDREKFLAALLPLVGGRDNTSLCEFQDDALYITLKDAGLADETAVAKLPEAASVTLRRGRLTVTFGTPERKEEVPFMANKNTDYRALAKEILANVGGKENVTNCFHCMTRLRFNLKDIDLVNIDAIKKLNVFGAQITGGQLQIIIGNYINEIYDAVCVEGGFTKHAAIDEKVDDIPPQAKKKLTFKGVLNSILDALLPLVGGRDNTSLCEFQDDALYITLKDAGLADETAVAKLPEAASVTLRRGRLTVTFGTPERKEEVPFMANKNTDYRALAKEILANVGGKENVTNCFHCMTRLRFNLKDIDLVNIDAIKKLNVFGAQITGGQLQIIIGNYINEIYDAVCVEGGFTKHAAIDEKVDDIPPQAKKKLTFKGVLNSILDAFVGSIVPTLPILIGSGIIKAVVLLLTQLGAVSADSPTIVTLSFVADAAYYFLPVYIGFFAAKKFDATPALGALIGAMLVHPTFVQMVTEGSGGSVFGLPIYAASYSSTIFPAVLSVWVMSYVEHFISRHSPKSLRVILQPTLTILIMTPLSLCLLSPIGAMLSSGFCSALMAFYSLCGPIAVAVFCAIVPFVVMFGMHVGTVPFCVQAIASTGIEQIILPAFFLSNFTQGAACLAVGVKTKKSDLRALAFSCAFSDIVPGVSEPGMYGITLKYKTPMVAAMIGGAAGGFYMGLMGVGANAFVAPNLFALAVYIWSVSNLINTVISILIAMVITFVLTLFLYKES